MLLTSWRDDLWQCDPVIVPRVSGLEPQGMWVRALEQIGEHAVGGFEVPVRDDDRAFEELAEGSGLVAGERSNIAWMDAADRRSVRSLAEGFALVDRTQRRDTPHPMRHRNGDGVGERLGQCSLYDPELDLAVETVDARVVSYSLYWFDPVTKVGLVEPVRVEDEHQRRGLGRAMLTAGIDPLALRGAQRVKIGFGTEAAAGLYQGVGFQPTTTDTWYEGRDGAPDACIERLSALRDIHERRPTQGDSVLLGSATPPLSHRRALCLLPQCSTGALFSNTPMRTATWPTLVSA
ncbi:MAG: GNAT family N-acetyltransferase [Nocardioidaceae bacterium]|nr:GNAT family N-acetyltransferase [Nocardioidaceae bacterium]